MLWNFIKWLPGAITVLLMFGAGVGPKDAASHLSEWLSLVGIDVPSWLESKYADKLTFWIALAGFLAWFITIFIGYKKAKPSRKPNANEEFQRIADLFYGQPWWKRKILNWWNRRKEPPRVLPPGYIYMKEAARKLYEASKAGKIPFGEASERLSGWSNDEPSHGSPEDILHWWAGHISKELPVYGRRPPSSIFKEIPRRDVKHFIFAEEATKLKDPIHDSVYYTDIAVQIEALDVQYHFQAGFHER